ncbi:hypothetical protein J3R82DRAFT_1474 [Butyriboletus roseoflavus]|nr:hypothetical protein J3R82DRAFT_1474 [Butyriboletus roseoflavus]
MRYPVQTCTNSGLHGYETSRTLPIPPRYQCDWEVVEKQPCGDWIEGGSKEVWSHVRTAHGLKGLYSIWCHCKWGGCLEKLKVSSLQRHIAKHLNIKWCCSSCDMVFARHDYVR